MDRGTTLSNSVRGRHHVPVHSHGGVNGNASALAQLGMVVIMINDAAGLGWPPPPAPGVRRPNDKDIVRRSDKDSAMRHFRARS